MKIMALKPFSIDTESEKIEEQMSELEKLKAQNKLEIFIIQ